MQFLLLIFFFFFSNDSNVAMHVELGLKSSVRASGWIEATGRMDQMGWSHGQKGHVVRAVEN